MITVAGVRTVLGLIAFVVANLEPVAKWLLVVWLLVGLACLWVLVRPLRTVPLLADRRWPAGLLAFVVAGLPLLSLIVLALLSSDHDSQPSSDLRGVTQVTAGVPRSIVVASIGGENHLLVINPRSGDSVAIPAGVGDPAQAYGLPDGTKFYVLSGGLARARVAVFDARSLKHLGNITLPVAVAGRGAAIGGDGSSLYVSSIGGRELFGIDTRSDRIVQTLEARRDFAVSPDARVLYTVARGGHGAIRLDIVELASGRHQGSLTIDAEPYALARTGMSALFVSPDARSVYITGDPTRIIDVGDPTAPKLRQVVSLGAAAMMSRITPDGRELWAPLASGEIAIIDLSTGQRSQTIHTERFMSDLCFAPDSSTAYVSQTRAEGPMPTSELIVHTAFLQPIIGALVGSHDGVYDTRPLLDTPGEIGIYDVSSHRPLSQAVPTTSVPTAMMCMSVASD